MSKIRVSQELQLPKEASVAKKLEYSKPAWTEAVLAQFCLVLPQNSDFISQSALSLLARVTPVLISLVVIIWLAVLFFCDLPFHVFRSPFV